MTQLITIDETTPIKYADLLKKVPFGQSHFQSNNFLVNNEYTPHRQLRQVLLQYDQLCYTLLTTQNKQAQTELDLEDKYNEIDRLTHELQSEANEFDRKSKQIKIKKIQLEVEEILIGKAQSDKLIQDALADKANYENQLAVIVPQVEALEAKGIAFEDAEKMYWTARFTEDARLTMFGNRTGHQIDKEILRSILHLEDSSRNIILQELGVDHEMVQQSGLLAAQNIQSIFALENKNEIVTESET